MFGRKAVSGTREKQPSLLRSLPAIGSLIRPYWRSLLLCAGLIGISQVAHLVLPYSSKYLIDTVVLGHSVGQLLPLISIVFASILVHAGCYYSSFMIMADIAIRLTNELRRRLQMHVVHLPIRYFDNNLSGALVSRIMSDPEGMLNLIGIPMLDFFAALLTGAITVYILVQKSWNLTLALVCILSAGGYALYHAFSRVRLLVREMYKIRAEVSGRLSESISGIHVVKGYRAERREEAVFTAGTQRLIDNFMQVRPRMSTVGIAGILLTSFNTLIVMYLGGHWLLSGRWTLGDYAQYSALIMYIVNPVLTFGNTGTLLTQAIAGLDRVGDLIAEKVEDADHRRTVAIRRCDGEVLFDDVSFGYEKDRRVLHNVSFHALPGTVTALVGPSGSGKSTVISLLCAFHKPQSGRILIDKVDLASITLNSYRSQLGLVLQETFLFDGTMRENLLFARPDATEKELMHACRVACVDEFAEKFPKSYDTVVGERGVKLSGGQKQRVSIARAIIADPRILVLDEATSSLDSESEAMIQAGLNYLMQRCTSFVVAHRLSTIRRSNQILVLEEGRIVDRGTHESLYQAEGLYYELYNRQYGAGTICS